MWLDETPSLVNKSTIEEKGHAQLLFYRGWVDQPITLINSKPARSNNRPIRRETKFGILTRNPTRLDSTRLPATATHRRLLLLAVLLVTTINLNPFVWPGQRRSDADLATKRNEWFQQEPKQAY